MGTYIIIAILAVIVLFSLRGSLKHFKGQGGCCGGGADVKPEKKKLQGQVVANKIITIEGMHCSNCKNSVERQINKIDGAAAKVHLKKNIAIVSMDRIIPDEELIRAVESVDFKVTKIELKEA